MASIPNYDDDNAVNRHFDLARALVTAPTQKPLLITPRAVRTIPIAESEIGERMVDDIILGFMAEFQRKRKLGEKQFEAALLVCGRQDKYEMAEEVREMFEGLDGAPVMLVRHSTHEAMKLIHDFTPKLNIDDKNRVMKAVEHYEPFVDFDQLLRRASLEE